MLAYKSAGSPNKTSPASASTEKTSNDGLSNASQQDKVTAPTTSDTPLLDLASGEQQDAEQALLERIAKCKKVNLTITGDAWDKLSLAEKTQVVEYVEAKQAYVKNSKKVKYYTISLYAAGLEEQSDEQIASLEQQARANNDKIDNGKTVNGVISVDQTKRVVPITEVQRAKEEAKTFDAESTFPSAKYAAEDMNNAAFQQTLAQAADEMKRIRDEYGPDVGLDITVQSGESLVTPPKGMETGDLADLRAQTAIAQAQAYFSAQGLDTTSVSFLTESFIGTTPYIPGVSDPHDPKFTAEQFLRVAIEMNGKPPPELLEGEPTSEAEVVKLTGAGMEKGGGGKKNKKGGRDKGAKGNGLSKSKGSKCVKNGERKIKRKLKKQKSQYKKKPGKH